MNPDEVEFLAETVKVSIIPSFSYSVVHLISGDIGPFRASMPVRVPLWMAVNLRQQKKCLIQPPDWMEVEKLEEIKEREKQSLTFTKMPSEHYMVVTKLLLDCSQGDIPRADEVRTIVKDIWDIRMSKLRSSVDTLIKNAGLYAAVNNLTVMEINAMRPLLPFTLDQFHRIKMAKSRYSQSQSTNVTFSSSVLS